MYNTPYNFNPYTNINNIPFSQIQPNFMPKAKGGLLKGITNIKWSEVLNNTQKTLNVINQAIPVYYQIKPIFNNVKNFGRLISAFNENDQPNNNVNNNNLNNQNEIKKENSSNSPTFFIN